MNTNLGNITLSEEVINSIVCHTIDNIEGIYTKSSITEKVLNKNLFVNSKVENDEIYIHSSVEVDYGIELIPLINKTQKKIKEEIKLITSLDANEINIKVVGIKSPAE